MELDYLVWSNEHRRWWGKRKRGYVTELAEAGRFTRAEALLKCADAMGGMALDAPLAEVPVRIEDVEAIQAELRARRKGWQGVVP
ncbi:hypothetical protein [Poseidonocella sp. HB161398]|uniref:hypothetical protein n=1 Tax=Poseidonocella sp. HB161398 TaxID=2320855 RepID=UPI0011097628|nr:hypothetical protein [Poseidonocella sp. HB161398]